MRQLAIIILLIYLQLHQTAVAQISMIDLQPTQKENAYYISTKFNIEFNKQILDALEHGIPLTFNIELKAQAKRKWLPGYTVTSKTISYHLRYQPLTEDFLTINLETGVRNFYDTLTGALSNICQLNNHKLIDSHVLRNDLEYNGLIRIYLDRDKLPSPMRPQAYFSDKWQLETKWHKWQIKK